MESRQKRKRAFAAVYFALSALCMAYSAYRVMRFGMTGVKQTVVSIVTVGVTLLLGAYLYASTLPTPEAKRRAMRNVLFAFFAFYLVGLFGTLFFGRAEQGVSYAERRAYYAINWDTQTNFVPFQTIKRYVDALSRNVIPKTSVMNLLGNAVLMAPMAFFLPCLFPSTRRFWKFLLLMMAFLAAMEALQLALCIGICDVDDLILNLLGALIVYIIVSLPFVTRMLKRLHLWTEAPGAVAAADAGTDLGIRLGALAAKSAVSVGISLLIGFLLGRESMCILAPVVALISLSTGTQDTLRTSAARLFGVLLGACFGCAAVVIGRNIPIYEEGMFVVVLPCMLLFVIYLLNAVKLPEAVIAACAVILLVGIQIGSAEGEGVRYAAGRALDALTGGIVGFLVNVTLSPGAHQSADKREEIGM